MKGTNTMELNESAMIEAVQEWLDKRWNDTRADCPNVTSVKVERNPLGGDTFKVKLTEETGV